MSNVGNKGKFSDRLKRMKLIRYSKKMKLKFGDTINLEEDSSKLKRKVIEGVSIGISVVGVGISNILDSDKKDNKFVDNEKLFSTNSKNSQFLNKDTVDISNNDYSKVEKTVDNQSGIEEKEDVKTFVKRKAVETASLGAAVVGAIGVNLVGGNSQKVESVSKLSSNNVDKNLESSNDGYNQDIDFGNNERKSFQRVFQSGNDIIVIDKISDEDISNGDKKTYLASQIVKKIKREFERKLNQIEVLESELYLLNEHNENELDLERCKEIKKEIEELISKINHIIEQYNIYQCNRFLDDMLDIDDHTLVDDISDFKRLYEGAELQRRLVSDYELISEYQLLYSRLDEIKTNVEDVSRKNDDKVFDYDKRDKKYESMQKQIVSVDKFNEDCERYIKDQNDYIDDIEKKVSKIDINQIADYRLQGFGNLVGGSLRYLRRLARIPFASLLFGISFHNYAANRMVNNLRGAMHLEKITSTIYKAQDYQFELNDKINTLDYNYESVDRTLDNVKKLKREFMGQYRYDIPGYNETLRKINEIENLVYGNKEKLDLIREKLKRNKKLNEETLHKCKILQKKDKPTVEKVA